MLDKAKERAKAKNLLLGGNTNFPIVLPSSNSSLSEIASVLGVNLRCALDMVDSNLDLIKDLEQARVVLFLQGQIKQKANTCEYKTGYEGPDSVALIELNSDSDDPLMDLEEVCLNKFQMASSGKKINKSKGSPRIFLVKPICKSKRGVGKKKRSKWKAIFLECYRVGGSKEIKISQGIDFRTKAWLNWFARNHKTRLHN